MIERSENNLTTGDDPTIFEALDATIQKWEWEAECVADLLAQIRDEHLYRELEYATFEEFLGHSVGITTEDAYRVFGLE